jgi:hypothetical protein
MGEIFIRLTPESGVGSTEAEQQIYQHHQSHDPFFL